MLAFKVAGVAAYPLVLGQAWVVAAVKEVGLSIPLVVRLEGTNVKEGRAILEASGLALETAGSLDEAAQKAVTAAKAQS